MKRIHIIGRKNSGKTTLIEELVAEFSRRGCRVGTVKHTHHRHELDTPGKDSHRHRLAGSHVVGILSRDLSAVFQPVAEEDDEARYAAIEAMYRTCDLVLVEGNSRSSETRLEVWRSVSGEPPIAASDAGIHAVITHEAEEAARSGTPVPCWPRSDVEAIADGIARLLQLDDRSTSS